MSALDVPPPIDEDRAPGAPGLPFDEHPCPMWIVDLETLRFLAVNSAALARHGYARAEFLERTALDIRPDEDAESHMRDLAALRRRGLDELPEYAGRSRVVRGDGSVVSVEILRRRILFKGREAVLVLAVDADPTGPAARLVDAQKGERRRIARELHDEIGQTLTALRLLVDRAAAAAPESVRQDLKAAGGLAEDLVDRVRAMSLDLRPPLLDQRGLLATLSWKVGAFREETRLALRFEHDGLDRRFPADVELAAYRVVQESLTNVARHAGAREVRVRAWATEHALFAQVEDDGRGFDVEAALVPSTSSFGLVAMRERVASLGGRLTIDARPGRGVRVTAELPLVRDAGPT